jgi:ABC-type multidrug transport system ATPase subunit
MSIICSHIDFCYPGTPIPVLRDLCLSLSTPGLHALFGPSGVGKTSLAKLLSGDITADSGKIQTEGLPTILYTHNHERLPGWASIGRHLDRITPDGAVGLKNELVEKFGLSGLLNQRFRQLSLGQQNRINLLRYLIQDFQMLIMDESLANVDEQTRGRIMVTIKETFPHVFFLYISHNLAEVARYAQQIWILRDADKSPQAISIKGLDLRVAQEANPAALKQTMLEMVNAA